MLKFLLAQVVCASSLCFLSVLLGAFLDDQWRTRVALMASGGLSIFCSLIRVPASVNVVRVVRVDSSPLVAHAMPWFATLSSLVLAAIFFLSAAKMRNCGNSEIAAK